jgi:cellulase/cellobiase CelA1
VQNQWPGGFTANVTINNTSSNGINGWTLKFTFPATQSISQVWNASVSQSGEQVTIQNLSYNATIAAGGSTAFGFNGPWNGSNPAPTSFTLNNATCSVV